MNRYTAAGLLADATAGKNILVFARSVHVRRDAVEELIHAAVESGDSRVARASRANGMEKITFPSGGKISFSCDQEAVGHPGMDIIYLADLGDDRFPLSLELLNFIGRGGELIRAD